MRPLCEGPLSATEPFNLWKLVYLLGYVLPADRLLPVRACSSKWVPGRKSELGHGLAFSSASGRSTPLVYVPITWARFGNTMPPRASRAGRGGFREWAGRAQATPECAFACVHRLRMDTYERIWSRKLETWLPARARRLFQAALRYWIDRTVRDGPGTVPGRVGGPAFALICCAGGSASCCGALFRTIRL